MPRLKKAEKLLSEAVRGFFSQKAKLGLAAHDKSPQLDPEHPGNDRAAWFQWEGIDDAFALKASGSAFFESLTAAFNSVHSYKYLDNPTFKVTLDSELRSQGIPSNERGQALKYVDEIIQEYKGKKDAGWGERDAGWNLNMDEIADMTRNADQRDAETSEPFTGGGPAPKKDELQKGFTK